VVSLLPLRLKQLRQTKGLNQKELAALINSTRETVSAYENGRVQPPPFMLEKIATVLNTSIDYLLGLTDDPRPTFEILRQDVRRVPVYNGVCAGIAGSYPDGSTVIDYIFIPEKSPGMFGVKVYGDSMTPEISEGDYVIVDPNLSYVSGDRVVVIMMDTPPQAFVKIFREQNGIRILQSLNPAYAPIVVNKEIRIVGKVVGVYRKY